MSAVPVKELISLAHNSGASRTLVPVNFAGQPHYAYVRAIQTPNAERQRFFGVLVPQSVVTEPFMHQVKVSLLVSAGLLALMLPLAWAFAYPIVRPVRELAAENDKIRDNQQSRVKRVRSNILEIDQLSESIVEMVHTIKRQEQEQRDLMDAFIEVIAQAIDQKSPYTGGHCARVPQLALMLVKAAESSDAPAFKDFSVASRDAWRELRIAGWLHDCGKVITPEYVVDKATKLETIYNRIHEIRTRFEVLWRDAEIDCLNKTLKDPAQAQRWQMERDAQRQKLQDDFAFIAACNIGGEYLDENKQMRLKQLAGITWQRHFDDRSGISDDEAQRYVDPPAELPVTEPLLQDRTDHLIKRQHSLDYIANFGITMAVPEYLYNRGELYNLLVSKGTLTTEERFKINEHIIGTIRMLEALPFPKALANVPRYASTHHEKVDGTGYPRGLKGDELSIPEHMLVLADIFEALTAADRPYKEGKTLSETLTILSRMVDDQHVDRDAFELLLTSGIYLRYAEKFMNPKQIDEVDISQYLRSV
jgi:HD-GYP domain-containing protein (c-di-GMP phosphodiesterase class II)